MKRALIVGAGIAGLATALRLTRDGWHATVLERAPALRTGGYVVNLIGLGCDAADRLGLLPALRRHDLGLITTVLVRADGRPKFTVPSAVAEATVGPRALTVFRGDLETVLHEAVREVADVRFGVTTTAVDQDPSRVRAQLSDGTTEEVDLLVGADGLHSATRAALFGDGHRVDLPYAVGAFPLTPPVIGVPERSSVTFIGAGRTAGVMNFGPHRTSAFFAYRTGDPSAELARGPLPALRAAFGDLGGGPAGALSTEPEDVYFDAVSQVVMPRWSDGRVVLIGDAAWCVTLFAGHGAGLAMTGADRLGAALKDHSTVPEALAAWEAGLRPETVKRQAMARRGMRQFAPPSEFHVRLGDLALRAMTLPGIRTLVRRGVERANR
ncbi:FAD-dependent oxidoreductase [Actinoplanes sp. NBRC 103695]|uniref:FAD-dependent oxidoreductase n=1 Tax=Actinoplanes sp. NBRC 103695 TaxID=3032202 RepID=UPI00249FF3BA|nr:FAD-dependent oxidoreductase [Actinoplanes sp. NBRC 103695]GLY95226.1 FAD-dependent oxidoreductase [Actinoplanes sp. NBRC 103695]